MHLYLITISARTCRPEPNSFCRLPIQEYFIRYLLCTRFDLFWFRKIFYLWSRRYSIPRWRTIQKCKQTHGQLLLLLDFVMRDYFQEDLLVYSICRFIFLLFLEYCKQVWFSIIVYLPYVVSGSIHIDQQERQLSCSQLLVSSLIYVTNYVYYFTLLFLYQYM